MPTHTPMPAEAAMTRPSLMSTWPYFQRLYAPTMALGNLWHMLLATATVPGTPRLIMPGVSTKAPPEPMKPLTRPPMKPTTNKKAMFITFKSINCTLVAMSCMGASPLRIIPVLRRFCREP